MPVLFRMEYQVGNASGERVAQAISAALERAGDNVRNLGKFIFPRLIPVLEEGIRQQFDAEGQGPHAGSWAPLAEDYRAWKERNYPGRGILVRSGNLREGLTNSASPFASRDYSGSELAFGTKGLEYASFHQLGTSRMAARPPLDFGEAVDKAVRKAVQQGIVEAIRDADRGDVLGEPEGEP